MLSDQFRPLDVPKDPSAYDTQVGQMAHRIVQTYLAASPEERRQGETFYSQDAHGSARALAMGVHPDSAIGHLMRTTPSPGEKNSEFGQGVTEPHPHGATPATAAVQERVHRAAGTIARLSPQTAWETNVTQAHEAHTLPEETVSALMQDKREPLHGTMLNRQPTRNVLWAREIAAGHAAPEEHVKNGPKRVKVGSFQNNIEYPDSSGDTTVDFRAHDIAAGRPLQTSTERGLTSKKRYTMFEDAHSRATDIINAEHAGLRQQKAPLTPKQVQAGTWWADKNFQDRAMGGGAAHGTHLHANHGQVMRRSDLPGIAGQF